MLFRFPLTADPPPLSLTSSWFLVYHLIWHWFLTLLYTVAVKMQISQDSAFLFCLQFTVWCPHLLAAEPQTRMSAISILLSLCKMPLYLFFFFFHKLQHSSHSTEHADQCGYKLLSLRCLGLRPWHYLHIPLYAFWVDDNCRQITEIKLQINCPNISGR